MDIYTYEQYRESAQSLAERLGDFRPRVLLILGSGLGKLGDEVEDPVMVPYGEVPHMKRSTAPDHAGRFVFGRLAGQDVAVMQGRLHTYEGWSFEDVSYPVRVLRLLGARVRELRVSVFGAELVTSAARLSYPGEIAAVLAGPAVNLLCALVLGGAHAWVAAGAHLSLCLFNLLPVRPLDGGRALFLAAAWLAGPSAAERIACWAGGTTALALGGLVLWLIGRTGGSLWLLPAAFGLLAAAAVELEF